VLQLLIAAGPHLPSLSNPGPEDIHRLITIFFVLLSVGFVIALFGHIAKSRVTVALGLALIFIGTGIFLVAVGQQG
jgi:hypothetical protein